MEVIQNCIKKTLLYLMQQIADWHPVTFMFKAIGTFCIKDQKVNMTFLSEFIQAMDGIRNFHNAVWNVSWSLSQQDFFHNISANCYDSSFKLLDQG